MYFRSIFLSLLLISTTLSQFSFASSSTEISGSSIRFKCYGTNLSFFQELFVSFEMDSKKAVFRGMQNNRPRDFAYEIEDFRLSQSLSQWMIGHSFDRDLRRHLKISVESIGSIVSLRVKMGTLPQGKDWVEDTSWSWETVDTYQCLI